MVLRKIITKRRLLRALLGLGVLLLVAGIGYWVYERSAGQSQLEKAEAELAQTEPHWRFPELNTDRAGKFPADNANLYNVSVRLGLQTTQSFYDWNSVKTPNGENIQKLLPCKPRVEMIQAMDAVRKENEQAITEARSLKKYPRGGAVLNIPANAINTPLGHLLQFRTAGAILSFDAWCYAIDGDMANAIADTLTVLQIGHAIDDEPDVISQLVREAMGSTAMQMTERTLAYSESKVDLAELQRAFAEEAEAPIWANMIRANRAQSEQYMVWIDNANVYPAIGNTISATWDNVTTSYYRCHIPHCRAKNLETSAALLAISRRPPQEWRDAFSAMPKAEAYSESLLHDLSSLHDLHLKSCLMYKTRLRTAAAAIACERYRQVNGHWPGTWAEIPKSILPEAPLDPYDGQPLQTMKKDDGILIYSHSVYKKENMDIYAPEKGDTIPAISFRLWDVAQRGKLPPIE